MNGPNPAPPVAHQHNQRDNNWSGPGAFKIEKTEDQPEEGFKTKQQQLNTCHIPIKRLESNNITLWQFLLELLADTKQRHLIIWTGQDGEFKLQNAEEVARMWGLRKNKNNMNYDKLSRALRYYYDKNIIKKVMGQKFVYKFVSFPEQKVLPPHMKVEAAGQLARPNSYPGTVEVKMKHHPLERPGPMTDITITRPQATTEDRLVPLDCSVRPSPTLSSSTSTVHTFTASKYQIKIEQRERSPIRSSPPPYPSRSKMYHASEAHGAYVSEARMHNEPKLVDSSERPISTSLPKGYTTSAPTKSKVSSKPKPVQLTVPPIICAGQQLINTSLNAAVSSMQLPGSPSYLSSAAAVTALHTPALPATPIMVASPVLGQGGTPLFSQHGTPLVHLWGTFSPLPLSPSMANNNTFQFPNLVNGVVPSPLTISGVPMQPITPVLLTPPSSKAIIVT